MSKENLILTSIPASELVTAITNSVIERLNQQPKEDAPKEHLTRAETAEKLKISLPTLHRLTKDGLLISYKFGNRVLYKSTEIDLFINSKSVQWSAK